MPIYLNWYDTNKTILIYTFEGRWTWEEFHEIDKPTWKLIADADYRIDIIIDYTTIERFPLGILDAIHYAGEGQEPQSDGHIVVIGGPYFLKILYGVFRRVYPRMSAIYHLVDTYDDAICILKKQRGKPIIKHITPFKNPPKNKTATLQK